jgi:hypothetical protein
MNVPIRQSDFRSGLEQRSQVRYRVAIPALAWADGARCSVSVLNLTTDGAMIRAAAALPVGSPLVLNLGAACVAATVVWHCPDQTSGLKFDRPLSSCQLEGQLFRSAAVAALRARKCQVVPTAN